MARGGEPWQFYPTVIVTIEWPLLLFGTIGAVSLWRRNSFFAAFLIWDFVVSLIVYSIAGEKFAWLVLHPLLPLVLLSGVGLQAIWQSRGALRYAGLAAAAVALFYVGISSWWINVDRGPPTRARCSSRRSPPRTSRTSPTRSRRSRTAAAPAPSR